MKKFVHDKNLRVRLPAKTLEALQARSDEMGYSLSEFIRHILRKELNSK